MNKKGARDMSRCPHLPPDAKCPLKVAAGRAGGLRKSKRKTRACRKNARKAAQTSRIS